MLTLSCLTSNLDRESSLLTGIPAEVRLNEGRVSVSRPTVHGRVLRDVHQYALLVT